MLIYLALLETEEEKSKFEELYNLYKKTMFYVANEVLHDEYLAEEAVHQAFINIIKILNDIEEINCHKTRGLIVIIVKNISIDYYRKRKRENTVSYDEAEAYLKDVSSIDENAENKIEEMILRLPDNYSSVMLLRYFQGYTDKEIAKILNLSETNIRKRISRGKNMLMEMLEMGSNNV